MRIDKAVITAAGPDQRSLPLQTLVDRDGQKKSALRIIVEEAASPGIESIALITRSQDRERYREAVGSFPGEITFVSQDEPLGYADALLRARDFVGDEPFLHLVSDHLCVHHGHVRCAQQLVGIAQQEKCSISAVQPTREHLLPHYGAVGGVRVSGSAGLFEVRDVLEKPTPTEAEQKLIVAGLRASHYLCFFGMHVLTPGFFSGVDPQNDASLSGALQELATRERYLALDISGQRYDLGDSYGLVFAQLALSLEGEDRESILKRLVEFLTQRELAANRTHGL